MDSDDQYGIVEAITIHVHAEAYDVALDMSFPKGTDGGIDFGTVRVGEEGKNQLTLKNKGRYEIAYKYVACQFVPFKTDLSHAIKLLLIP